MKKVTKKVVIAYLLRKKKEEKMKKKHWVHPLFQNKKRQGAFHNLIQELKDDDEKYFNYFRMSKASYYELLHRLGPALQRQDTTFRNALTPPTINARKRLTQELRAACSVDSSVEMHGPIETEAALRSFCFCRTAARVEAAFRRLCEAASSVDSSVGLHGSPKLRLRRRKTEAAFRRLVWT